MGTKTPGEIMRAKTIVFSGLLCGSLVATSACAEACLVDDPTGTPLNVRASPNGSILGALFNGVRVEITDMTLDRNGKRWAHVVPLDGGRRGWVFREFLDCRR
jgi:SH3 domain-containing protein